MEFSETISAVLSLRCRLDFRVNCESAFKAHECPPVGGLVFAREHSCLRKSNAESERAGRGGKRGARGQAVASRPLGW